jgi:hypothetical protein
VVTFEGVFGDITRRLFFGCRWAKDCNTPVRQRNIVA